VTDRLGSVVQTSSYQGSDYYPYGGNPSNFLPNQTAFATYEAAGTSMLYAQNRYYDSARGRFTTPDPSSSSYDLRNPLSFNRYAYVMGDPINKNDPSGLCGNDSSDDGSGDADGDGSNGDDDSGGGDISGGGGGGGEDEISDGHEMNADAFGRHRASRRRVKILGDTSDNPCAICQTGYSVLNGQCVRTGTFIPPGTPLMSSTQSPWSAYYSCVGLGWAAYFSSGTFLYTNLGAPFAPGKPPGYGLVLAGISDLGAAYSIRQNCTQQAFGSGFSPGITSGGNP
jgi:RHS repeat-associated protein